jgi:CheY-like chemotaxis protein
VKVRDVVVKVAEPVPGDHFATARHDPGRRRRRRADADDEAHDVVVDGAVGVLPKPFTKDDLLASIDVALPQSLTR